MMPSILDYERLSSVNMFWDIAQPMVIPSSDKCGSEEVDWQIITYQAAMQKTFPNLVSVAVTRFYSLVQWLICSLLDWNMRWTREVECLSLKWICYAFNNWWILNEISFTMRFSWQNFRFLTVILRYSPWMRSRMRFRRSSRQNLATDLLLLKERKLLP